MRTWVAFEGPLFRSVTVRPPRLGLHVGVPAVACAGVLIPVITGVTSG